MKIDAKPPLSLHPKPDPQAQLKKAAQGFEELMLTQLLKAARAGHLGEDLLGSSAVDSTRDMFDAQIARASSGHTHFGIAAAVERQFSRFVKD